MKKYRFILIGLTALAALGYLVGIARGQNLSFFATAPDHRVTPTPNWRAMQVHHKVETSPAGKWLIEKILAFPKTGEGYAYIGMNVRRVDGEKERVLVDAWVPIEQAKRADADAKVLTFTQDERRLYYSLYIPEATDERCQLDPLKYDLESVWYGKELREVNLENGEITVLVPCAISGRFDHSPDKTIIPYIADREIGLIEVDTGVKHKIPFKLDRKIQFVGYVNWSPNSKMFAFDVILAPSGEEGEDERLVWVVDVDLRTARQLNVEGEKYLEIGGWESPSRLALVGRGGPDDNKRWIWDRESDTITRQAIPTKTPTPMGMPTPNLAKMNVSHQTSTSPDGRWIAETTIAFPYESDYVNGIIDQMYTALTIRSANGKMEWKIVEKWGEIGLGWSFPQPIRWSKDGRSLYYTHQVVPDGCVIFPPQDGLYQVDLESGKVTEWFPRGQLDADGLSLSPDEKTLAYVKSSRNEKGKLLQPLSVVLRDLRSREERAANMESLSALCAANIVWSPDGQFLAVTVTSMCCYEEGGVSSVLVVDGESLTVTPIVLEDKRYRLAKAWSGNEHLLLHDPQGNLWSWNRENGELIFLRTTLATPICAPSETPTAIPTDPLTPTPTATSSLSN